MRSLQFIRRGQPIALANVPPDRTLLQVLREDLGHTAQARQCHRQEYLNRFHGQSVAL